MPHLQHEYTVALLTGQITFVRECLSAKKKNNPNFMTLFNQIV